MAPVLPPTAFAFNQLQQHHHQSSEVPTMSRTHQYRKVMKPLLERKRRARINKYLDEMKDLMMSTFESEGESINKLEKADVLELTVRHLQKLKHQQLLRLNPTLDQDRFRSGYTACANEVSRFLSTVPGVSLHFGTELMSHLGTNLSRGNAAPAAAGPLSVNTVSTSSSMSLPASSPAPSHNLSLPMSPNSDGGYNSGRDSTPSPALSVGHEEAAPIKSEPSNVWRPF